MADTISCKQMPANPRCFVSAELILPAACFMSPLQLPSETGACHAMAFPHHPVQEKATSDARTEWPRLCQIKNEDAVAESENIVARPRKRYSRILPTPKPSTTTRQQLESAARQALTEAGLPLSWCRKIATASAPASRGFSVLSAADVAIAGAARRTMLAGWLLSQSKIASPGA